MKRISTAAVAASSLVVLLSLTACGERPDVETAGRNLDSPVARTGSTTTNTATQARQEAPSSSSTAVMGAAPDTAQAMPGAGQPVDDAQITSRVSASLMGDKELNKVQIDVDTRDGVVTLSGPVPSSTVKARANEIAKTVKDVKSVNNQLTVSAS